MSPIGSRKKRRPSTLLVAVESQEAQAKATRIPTTTLQRLIKARDCRKHWVSYEALNAYKLKLLRGEAEVPGRLERL